MRILPTGWRFPRCAILIVVALAATTQNGRAQETPDRLLARAIAAAGGQERLSALPAMEWNGTAQVHIPGREINLAGLWRIQPPESAVVSTYEIEKGPGSTRRLILAGDQGWTVRDSQFAPLDPGFLAEERHQFYLYSLLRLVPLKGPNVVLTAIGPDSSGHAGILVRQPGHLDVSLYFGADARVARLVTTFATADSSTGAAQEISLTGTIEAWGVRWFRQMSITRDGQPSFDLTLTRFRPLAALDDPWLAGPP